MKTDALKKLHTAMLDTREGYEVAERDAETPELKALFGEMVALRGRDHEAIHHALERAGETPDERGSFMATIHKTVTSVRSTVTGINAGALAPFIGGEETILAEYDEAIREASADDQTRDMLGGQKTVLSAKVAEMKSKKA